MSLIHRTETTQHGLEQIILDYESDTFSAEGSQITEVEAKRVAQLLITWLIDNRLDGDLIDGLLYEVRNK